jgi:copper(I)-binding protein
LVPAAIGLGALIALTGCSAGQSAETTTEVSAVNGGSASTQQIDIRNAVFTFPGGQSSYPAGSALPLSAVLVNNGSQGDRLLRVSSTYARSAQVTGDTNLPAGRALRATGTPPPTTPPTRGGSVPVTSGPDYDQQPTGEPAVTITLIGATQQITPGVTIPVTFYFQHAGAITLQVPIGPDPTVNQNSAPQP